MCRIKHVLQDLWLVTTPIILPAKVVIGAVFLLTLERLALRKGVVHCSLLAVFFVLFLIHRPVSRSSG